MRIMKYARKGSDGQVYNLADPRVRKLLLDRVGTVGFLGAFELLWHFYFCNDWENDFDPKERRLMQELVGETAVSGILSDGGENAKTAIAMMLTYEEPPPVEILELFLRWLGELRLGKDRELRRLASLAVLKFLPAHRDLYEAGLVIGHINSALDAEDDQEISGNIRRLQTSVKLRYEHDQAHSQPE